MRPEKASFHHRIVFGCVSQGGASRKLKARLRHQPREAAKGRHVWPSALFSLQI
jgi:hypothetical protein